MFASFDCLLIKRPLSKSSKELVPKSGISGVLGLNTHDKNNVTPKETKGFHIFKESSNFSYSFY
jgi:hypothetical protein